ncbi:hypothetical protein D9756_004989 [Leucocoprinus leucothites]|uniref:Cofilin n=1 Tax=Leucocoprinus leucothites TaxID=201217 RepID=A0A8H5G9D8_9AGAR|nr:hypothetical protein D9756_004989 [Leucoagaricus leucothites]
MATAQECLEVYQELKLKKIHKYIIYALNPTFTQIVVEKKSHADDYEEFLSQLPENEPRYAVYDVEYESEGGGRRNKIVFIAWTPDNAKIKQKMVYASSKDALRKSLIGIAVEVQASDFSEAAYESELLKHFSQPLSLTSAIRTPSQLSLKSFNVSNDGTPSRSPT